MITVVNLAVIMTAKDAVKHPLRVTAVRIHLGA